MKKELPPYISNRISRNWNIWDCSIERQKRHLGVHAIAGQQGRDMDQQLSPKDPRFKTAEEMFIKPVAA
jgi:hypothetical protein